MTEKETAVPSCKATSSQTAMLNHRFQLPTATLQLLGPKMVPGSYRAL